MRWKSCSFLEKCAAVPNLCRVICGGGFKEANYFISNTGTTQVRRKNELTQQKMNRAIGVLDSWFLLSETFSN